MVFEIDNIELNFREKKVLNGIYLKAETGKITGVLGRNGTGKSCLLQIVFGSLKPKSKLLRIDNKPFLKKLYDTGKVKLLPQNNFIPKYFSIVETFQFFQTKWDTFCTDFKSFSKYRNSKINELSGGEIRLIETYLILTSPADLLLLDEPFSHLAPIYVEKIKELIQKEKKRKAIVLTDHLYKEIMQISDEVYLLKDGFSKLICSEEELQFQAYRN